jgi:membrane protein
VHFGSYDVAYGSIGGVIVLMTWFYILGVIFLVGGEINATLEHQSPQGKDEGAHAAEEKAPPKEERPSAMPVGAAHSQDAAERAPGGAEADPAPLKKAAQ